MSLVKGHEEIVCTYESTYAVLNAAKTRDIGPETFKPDLTMQGRFLESDCRSKSKILEHQSDKGRRCRCTTNLRLEP